MPPCPDCGESLANRGRFCKACGWDADLEDSEEAYLGGVDLPTDFDEDAYQDYLAREGLGEPSRTTQQKRHFMIAGLVLALIAMAIFLGLLRR
ncbi:MAG: hypothetical protein ACYS22_19780 [Planctomycetota bacterium]|jgi:hypothetical protein